LFSALSEANLASCFLASSKAVSLAVTADAFTSLFALASSKVFNALPSSVLSKIACALLTFSCFSSRTLVASATA
jgi:hypothetical protein